MTVSLQGNRWAVSLVAGAVVAGLGVASVGCGKSEAAPARVDRGQQVKGDGAAPAARVEADEYIAELKAPGPFSKGKEAKAEGLDASNLSLISGIGPTIEKKLRAAGIASWNDIAAWTEADIAKWDEELKLRGRATREEWVEQAKELLAGKPPRAKADQEVLLVEK